MARRKPLCSGGFPDVYWTVNKDSLELTTRAKPGWNRILGSVTSAAVRDGYAEVLDRILCHAMGEEDAGDLHSLPFRISMRSELLQWHAFEAAHWVVAFETIKAHDLLKGIDVRCCRFSAGHRRRHVMYHVAEMMGLTNRSLIIPKIQGVTAWLLGAVYGYAESLLTIRAVRQPAPVESGRPLVFTNAFVDTTTKHVLTWLKTQSRPCLHLVLGDAFKIKESYPESWAGLRPGLGALISFAPKVVEHAISSTGVVSRLAGFVDHRAGYKCLFVSGTRMARGAWAVRRLSNTDVNGRIAIFSLQTLEGMIIANELMARGAFVVHWLHGILASRSNLDGIANLAVPKSECDAMTLRESSHYHKVATSNATSGHQPARPRYLQRSPSPEGKRVLILSTIYHVSRTPSASEQYSELVAYLKLTIETLSGTGKYTRFAWRPHPYEKKVLNVSMVLEEHGLRHLEIDKEPTVQEAIAAADLIVTVTSGTIIDALKIGRVPLVFDGIFQERVGIRAALPDKILFRSGAELLKLIDSIDLLDTPSIANDISEAIGFSGDDVALPQIECLKGWIDELGIGKSSSAQCTGGGLHATFKA